MTPTLTISPTPPIGPVPGDLWYDNVGGYLNIWYDDGNSLQWVVANPGRGAPGPDGPKGDPAFLGSLTATAIQAGVVTFDYNQTSVFAVDVTGNITAQTILNAPPARVSSFLVQFTGNGTKFAQTWTAWTWLTGTPVLSSANGKRDLVVVFTMDGVNFFATMYAQYF